MTGRRKAVPSAMLLVLLAMPAAALVLPPAALAAGESGGGASAGHETPREGRIAEHERAMMEALAMPARTPAEIAAREAAIAAARAQELAEAPNRPQGGGVVDRVDQSLGLPPADPTLGIGRR